MNDETLLYRVISSAMWVQEGQVSSQAFRPRRSDNKRLSVYAGDQITPQDAWSHYTRDYNNPPIGVLAVTVSECDTQDLPVVPDPQTFPEHVLIDFSKFGMNQTKRKSGLLRDATVARDWQFRFVNP